MKETVVLFPGVGMGHLIPAIELAKLFTHHNFSVTIILLQIPLTSSNVDRLVSRISSTHPSISFHRLPQLSPPSTSTSTFPLFRHLRLANAHLRDFLTTLSQTSTTIRALVLDMFCTDALDVANELSLPAYFFFSSGAAGLALFLYFPTLQSEMSTVANFLDLGDSPLHFPGIPPIPASHIPNLLEERDNEFCKELIYHFQRLPKANGIIINTFAQLETRAVKALNDGLCVPGRTMPPIYCIGPLIADQVNGEKEAEKHECLSWLDAQPKGSVVFLCFGSMGSFKEEQLREIAIGLERSGQRFLWVVRNPLHNDPKKRYEPLPLPDLEALLPEGFIERNKERGMVVKSWAPQVAVLSHDAVGGFVSHCGWNSTLEAVSYGVATIAWPLYAEQRMNKVVLVEEARLAVEMEGYDKGMVSKEEVEKKVRWLMESEGGKELRDRAAAMRERAVEARREGGSSEKALVDLVGVLTAA